MIIGNGLVAKAFRSKYENRNEIIFASGVSNSLETDDSQFDRERQLLVDTLRKHPDQLVVYFSSRSIENLQLKELPYYRHKYNMEHLIKSLHPKYNIFRVHHIVGRGGNGSTIVNFLYHKILNGESFDLWQNACRYLIDVEDVFRFVDHIVTKHMFINQTVNVPAATIKLFDLVRMIENILKKSAVYQIKDKGICLPIDNSAYDEILEKQDITLDKKYINKLLVKYLQ